MGKKSQAQPLESTVDLGDAQAGDIVSLEGVKYLHTPSKNPTPKPKADKIPLGVKVEFKSISTLTSYSIKLEKSGHLKFLKRLAFLKFLEENPDYIPDKLGIIQYKKGFSPQDILKSQEPEKTIVQEKEKEEEKEEEKEGSEEIEVSFQEASSDLEEGRKPENSENQ